MSITRKELITSKYISLISKLELYNNDKLLPSISDYDITDIIQFIKMFFPIGSNYNQTIKGLLEDQEIKLNENEYLIVSSLIIDFIDFLNNI